MIKPAFFKHADLYDAEVESGLPLRVAFAGLWTVADRRGVFAWSRNIKPDVLPYDACDMLAVLDALAAAQLVEKYTVDGKHYGVIRSLADHQHFHRDEKENGMPDPPSHDASAVLAPQKHPASIVLNGRLATSDIRHNTSVPAKPARERSEYPPEFEALWAIYPPRSGGDSKRDALIAWRARVKEGATPEILHAGVERYAAYVTAEGNLNTRYVKMASTFLGRGDWYLQPWTIPAKSSPAADAPRVLRATEQIIA